VSLLMVCCVVGLWLCGWWWWCVVRVVVLLVLLFVCGAVAVGVAVYVAVVGVAVRCLAVGAW